MQTVRGARALFAVRAAALGWFVLSTILWSLPLGDHFELWLRAGAVAWLILGAAELAAVVPFSDGRKGTAAESPARALLMLLAVGFLLQVLQAIPELGGPHLFPDRGFQRAFSLAQELVFVAAEVCLWMALMRSLAQPPSWSAAFYALLALGAALGALNLVLPPDE